MLPEEITLCEWSYTLQNASLSQPEVVNDLSNINSSLLKAVLLDSEGNDISVV